MTDIIKTDEENKIISSIVLRGDLSGLNELEKVKYYNMFCESLGLNSVTKPFDIISLSGKQVLYAKKECTEQLRKINGVSIIELKKTFDNGLYIVEAKAQDKTGKIDISTGAVSIMNLKGDGLANAIMKAETKAKRRVTLSICGLGILDETELETIPEFKDISSNTDVKDELKNSLNTSKSVTTNENLIKKTFGSKTLAPKKDEIYNKGKELASTIDKAEFQSGFKSQMQHFIDLGKLQNELSDEDYVLELEYLKQFENALAAYRKNKTGAVNDSDPVDVDFHFEDKKEDDLPLGVK